MNKENVSQRPLELFIDHLSTSAKVHLADYGTRILTRCVSATCNRTCYSKGRARFV